VHGETGLLVPHGDVPALIDALGSLLRDHDLRSRMGLRAREHSGRYSWEASAEAVEAFLQRVVGQSGRH